MLTDYNGDLGTFHINNMPLSSSVHLRTSAANSSQREGARRFNKRWASRCRFTLMLLIWLFVQSFVHWSLSVVCQESISQDILNWNVASDAITNPYALLARHSHSCGMHWCQGLVSLNGWQLIAFKTTAHILVHFYGPNRDAQWSSSASIVLKQRLALRRHAAPLLLHWDL